MARVREVDESCAVDMVLAKGQVGLLHCNTVHGSGPNRSSGRRIGLINDYTPPSARQSTGMGSGQLMRGVDRWGHFGAEPAPGGACTPEDVLARRRILNAYPENVLMGPLGPDGVASFADEPRAGGFAVDDETAGVVPDGDGVGGRRTLASPRSGSG